MMYKKYYYFLIIILLIYICLPLTRQAECESSQKRCKKNECESFLWWVFEDCELGCVNEDKNRNKFKDDKTCECKDSYYHHNKDMTCNKCEPQCETCENGTNGRDCKKCIKQNKNDNLRRGVSDGCLCKNNASMDPSDNYICKCNDKYYEKSSNCQMCNSQCAKCVNNANNCTQCKDPNKILNNCTVCKDTYYDPGSGKNCQECQYPCLNCSNKNTCTSCQDPELRKANPNPQCSCLDGYYFDNQKKCLECSYPCDTCENSSTNCLTCKNTDGRKSLNDCDCIDGYYDDNTQCQQCNVNRCSTCVNNKNNCTKCLDYHQGLSSCGQCIDGAEIANGQQKCQCKTDYYSKDVTGTKSCHKCEIRCATCEDENGKCKTCASDRNNDAPTCTCKNGLYDTGNANENCLKCVYPCQNCSKKDVCTSCKTPENRVAGSNPSCACQKGYFEDGTKCAKCSDNCSSCIDNAFKCLECAENRVQFPVCGECKKGSTLVNGKCQTNPVIVFDPNGTEEQKKSRCMSSINIGGKQNCQICRADKNSEGKLINDQTQDIGNKGSYTLRKLLGVYQCGKTRNVEEKEEEYDQEEKIPFCELYDNYGLCIRCLVRYGLQWQYSSGSKTDGKYVCIPNEYRTPYCDRYDDSGKCVQCKWNQNEEDKDLYPSTKQEYQLDYGLITKNNKLYCINNLQQDLVMMDIDKDYKTSDIRSNCSKYNEKFKCIECHFKQFNYEGQTQWKQYSTDTEHLYESKEYLIDNKEGGKCIKYPLKYITHPDLLQKISVDESNVIQQTGTDCIQGYTFLKDIDDTSYFGCAKSDKLCEFGKFQWDYEAFEQTGQWHKKYVKCSTCKSGYSVSQNGLKCQQNDKISNCQQLDSKGCKICSPNYTLIYGVESNLCEKTIDLGSLNDQIANCKTGDYQIIEKDDKDVKKAKCLQCNFGYVPTQDGKCVIHTGYTRRGCKIKKDEDDLKCTSESRYGWDSNGKCQLGTVRNIDQLCYSYKGVVHIENCQIYMNTDDQSKCHKCEEKYYLDDTYDRCLKEPSNTVEEEGIEKCTQMDGPWCQRCQKNVIEGSNTVNYILTNQNTCVKNTFTNNQQCVYAEFNDNTPGRVLSTCLQCDTCYKLNEFGICEKDSNCSENDENIYLLSDRYLKVKGEKVDNCLIHKDKIGNCYQCDQTNSQIYGIYNNKGKMQCQKCNPDQIVDRSINGEYICVKKVSKCVQYSYDGHCIACESSQYLSIINNEIVCVETCDPIKQFKEFNSKQQLCITGSVDAKCQEVDNQIYYEYFKNGDKIQERCALCDDDYFIDVDRGFTCQSKSDFVNYDSNFQHSKVIKGLQTNTPSVLQKQDNLLNSPCKSSYTANINDYYFAKDKGYCFQKDIENCFIQNKDNNTVKQCIQCYPGYFLSDDKKTCQLSYSQPYLETGTAKENCLYMLQEKCLFCRYGYIPNSSQSDCILNKYMGCQKGSIASCDQCEYPFIRVPQKGSTTQFLCELQIPKCLVQEEQGICKKCEPGYEYYSKVNKCLRRSQNCYKQNFDISYDLISNSMKGSVCKGCFQSEDKIRLYYTRDKNGSIKQLVQSCVFGCDQLTRKRSKRSMSNPFNTWECSQCRNQEYHLNNQLGSEWCVHADQIQNCSMYVNKASNFEEICYICGSGYYLFNGGKECKSCQQTSNCIAQDSLATSLVDGKCKCSICDDGYHLLSTGACEKTAGEVKNCSKHDSSKKCIECIDQEKGVRFLNSDGLCEDYQKDLNCGGKLNENLSKISNTCSKCDITTQNRYLNKEGKCVKGSIDKCLMYESQFVCQQCENGYGLNFEKSQCLDNSKEKHQNNCFRYNESQNIDGYLACIECIRGYAIDYNFDDFKNNQCIKIDHCKKGYKKGSNIYCLECLINDYSDSDTEKVLKRVYRKAKPDVIEGTCGLYNKSDDKEIYNCKYYQTFTSTDKQCYQCHEGFSSDFIEGKGTRCISDEHPGTLTGCKNYRTFEIYDTDNKLTSYQKYEDLVCMECYQQWRYHQDLELNKFSINTFSKSCDLIKHQDLQIPKVNVWNGKDGGVRKLGSNNNVIDDKVPVNPGDGQRDFYDDPDVIVKSQILKLYLLTLVLYSIYIL